MSADELSMTKQVFRRWDIDQGEMFPPAFRDLVPADHLVHFIRELVIEDLDLSGIYAAYTAEPVFGQIKEARGFRRFLLRGLEHVTGEWSLRSAPCRTC